MDVTAIARGEIFVTGCVEGLFAIDGDVVVTVTDGDVSTTCVDDAIVFAKAGYDVSDSF